MQSLEVVLSGSTTTNSGFVVRHVVSTRVVVVTPIGSAITEVQTRRSSLTGVIVTSSGEVSMQ
jgi:hypothetical protein